MGELLQCSLAVQWMSYHPHFLFRSPEIQLRASVNSSNRSYVLLTIAETLFLAQWHAIRVIPYRFKAGVEIPHPYATPEQIASAPPEKKHALYLFNCAQRSQANFLESHSSIVAAMLIAGLRYPIATSVAGVIWSISRLVYAVGYTWKTGKKGQFRALGEGAWLAQFYLFGLAGWVGWKMLTE